MRIAELGTELAEQGWTLARALPRDAGHALLVLRSGEEEVAGQWFADAGRAARVAEQTAVRGGRVERPLAGVLVQLDGADRKLRTLADRCAAGGRLRAHRPERRAVVEVDGGSRFVKVVRPDRVQALVQTMSRRFDGVPTPQVVDVEERTGSVTTAALPGVTLHAMLTDGDGDGVVLDTMREIGASLGRLHAGPTADVATHGPAAEIAVVDRWIGLAAGFGADMSAARAARARLPELLVARRRRALLHRDLHDKQIVLGPAGPALLDLDLLAAGDPALDLANLAVHLELRARQGLIPPATVGETVAALLEGYRPAAATRAAATGYLLATRIRLAAVYSFRPAATAAATRLLTEPVVEKLT